MSQDNARGSNAPIALGGDLSGTLDKAKVIKLQGNSVASTTPTDHQILIWNNGASQWQPTTETVLPTVNVVILNGSTTYTMTSTDSAIVNNGSSNTINFPPTSPVGRIIFVADNTAGGHSFHIVPGAGSLVNGNGASQVYTYGGVFICINGTDWTYFE
jgi:hypothetical protein